MARRTKGEGSLYQASDKSWVFQYRVDKYGHALDEHKRASIGKLGGIYAGAKKTPSARKREER